MDILQTVSEDDDEPVTDPVEIAKAARALSQLLENDWRGNTTLWVTLLRALCRLAETGPASNNKGWPPLSIANVVADLGERSWNNSDEKTAKSRLNNHWKKLETNLDVSRDHILDRGPGFGLFLEPRNEVIGEDGRRDPKGGRGKKARYCLLFFIRSKERLKRAKPQYYVSEGQDMLSQESSPTDEQTPEQPNISSAPALEHSIRYYQIPTLQRLFPDDGISVGGWVGRLLVFAMTGTGLAILLLAFFYIYLLLYTPSVIAFLKIALVSTLLLVGLRIMLGWWWNLALNHVARAPLWWQSISVFGDNVIEKRLHPDGNGSALLHLVRYVADCPLCGPTGPGRSAVRLDSGRLEFYGRIVGRCRHAPNEHVWSFDHITQRGRFLR